MQLMARYPDKYFDLAIVDPPYGIGFSDYERVKSSHKTKTRHTKNGKKKWDDGVPDDAYFNELFRVSKNQIVWGGNYFLQLAKVETPNLKDIREFNRYMNNSTQDWIFWYKQNPVPNFADGELAWHSFKGSGNNQYDFRYYGNLEGKTSTTEKIHPTQKPVSLLKRLLALVVKSPDDVVLDCFSGSGSTGEACIEMKLKFIGFEIDDEYYGLAKDRLERAYRNRDTQITMQL